MNAICCSCWHRKSVWQHLEQNVDCVYHTALISTLTKLPSALAFSLAHTHKHTRTHTHTRYGTHAYMQHGIYAATRISMLQNKLDEALWSVYRGFQKVEGSVRFRSCSAANHDHIPATAGST